MPERPTPDEIALHAPVILGGGSALGEDGRFELERLSRRGGRLTDLRFRVVKQS